MFTRLVLKTEIAHEHKNSGRLNQDNCTLGITNQDETIIAISANNILNWCIYSRSFVNVGLGFLNWSEVQYVRKLIL